MSRRRPLVLLALVISSFALAACADMTAPKHDDVCRGGVVVGSGHTCDGQ